MTQPTPTPTPTPTPEPVAALLPCPFCGTKAIGGSKYAACGNSECQMNLRPLLIKVWNTRTPAPPKAEWAVEAAKEIRENLHTYVGPTEEQIHAIIIKHIPPALEWGTLMGFRDAVLNGRHQLESILDNDQTNAVLGLFDDIVSVQHAPAASQDGEDGARLDWLEKHRDWYATRANDGTWFWLDNYTGKPKEPRNAEGLPPYYPTLRAAIDAARTQPTP